MTKPTYEQLEQQLAAARQQIEALAAENATIKTMNDCLSEELRCYESDGAFEGPMMHLLWWQAETPATDAALAQIWAQGVEMAISKLESSRYGEGNDMAVLRKFAQQLRGEASK